MDDSRECQKVPELLKQMVPGLFDNPEAKQYPIDEDIPGAVCSRLADYLVSLHEQFNHGKRDLRIKDEIDKCYKAIERLASSSNIWVQNLVVTEIFEAFDFGPIVQKQIEARLGPKSRALYDEYKGAGIF
ncbi:MAG TPA: hypothetical protein VGH16_02420 [Candidatus Binatia bacterium]|jgi:hypothetical protein